jgi:4-amino-4-deoxy-L-arabinose transferase-like glycosyltransferase
VWLGPMAWMLALAGTLTLPEAGARLFSVVAVCLAGLLAVLAWGGDTGDALSVSTSRSTSLSNWYRENPWRLEGFVLSVLVAGQADLRFVKSPDDTFGLAGVLWLLGIVALVAATGPWPHCARTSGRALRLQRRLRGWCAGPRSMEILIVGAIVTVGAVLRIWNLAGIPFAIHPDEIRTGHVALQSYAVPSEVPFFSTQWILVDLPAPWFASVAVSLHIFGHTLAALRLPNAVYGTAAIVPFYAMVRHAWGQVAAIAGAWMLAVSAVDIHFSRVTVNNLVPAFFWAACFFFLLRGVTRRRAIDWSLAGITAGLSEYSFYGTRLLFLILLCFCVYLALIHNRRDLQSIVHFGMLFAGYVIAFGPLLAYFVQNPVKYFGRGQDELIWHQMPRSLPDAWDMATSLWPPVSDNLLGISTQADRGSFYFAPLLMPAEAGLLVLGVAILFWRWRMPAEFLMLLSGLGTLFVGGTLVVGAPNMQLWTPAFPAIFAAMAVPLGAWTQSVATHGSRQFRLGCLLFLALGLGAIAMMNVNFYFRDYQVTRPEFEIRAAQSRWEAGIGVKYRVFTVGPTWQPYDAETNSYLIRGQEGKTLLHPTVELPVPVERGKGLGFVFMNDETKYMPLVKRVYPGGRVGEIRSRRGIHLFYTYLVPPS